MTLYKTVTLPSGDPDGARRTFEATVLGSPYVVLVVVGAGSDVENLVWLADKVAGGMRYDTWRRVVWSKDPTHRTALLQGLAVRPGVPPLDDPEVVAFWIGSGQTVTEAIRRSELPADKARVRLGFVVAEGVGA